MRTQKSRRLACAFESLEGRALMAIYMKVGDIKGEVAQHQAAEVHIAQPPITQEASSIGTRQGTGRVVLQDIHI